MSRAVSSSNALKTNSINTNEEAEVKVFANKLPTVVCEGMAANHSPNVNGVKNIWESPADTSINSKRVGVQSLFFYGCTYAKYMLEKSTDLYSFLLLDQCAVPDRSKSEKQYKHW